MNTDKLHDDETELNDEIDIDAEIDEIQDEFDRNGNPSMIEFMETLHYGELDCKTELRRLIAESFDDINFDLELLKKFTLRELNVLLREFIEVDFSSSPVRRTNCLDASQGGEFEVELSNGELAYIQDNYYYAIIDLIPALNEIAAKALSQ